MLKMVKTIGTCVVVAVSLSLLAACGPQSMKRAGQGAAVGGLSGAAASTVSALIWGGDVGEAAARGAVWGATSGAVSGAIAGAHEDKRISEQQRAAAEKQLQDKLGEDGFAGLTALAKCKHKVAVGYAETAQENQHDALALAGLWLEAISYIDQGGQEKAEALYPAIIEADKNCETAGDVQDYADKAIQGLHNIRNQHNLPEC